MTLKTKPSHPATPYIVAVYDADAPEGSATVVARSDTRDGKVWRTNGAASRPPMSEIRAALRTEA